MKMFFLLENFVLFFSDISGERLWVELKRIAEGRNAGPVLKTLLQLNIGQYLGEKKKKTFFRRNFFRNSVERRS